ncbi:MAG: hypothetical protein EOS72_02960 [Mesorhizobium sp.]|uniref:hypothetical protein n=1 Tax=Mesorhizobium sp. TaxID=1871066 RepID=UPI000FE5AF74|nr:hypothetical protein [Mesorhizobium sp.]RWC91631.1 MAG: hypothetical protein EOS72_02960 [Mesorhizobium sp.]
MTFKLKINRLAVESLVVLGVLGLAGAADAKTCNVQCRQQREIEALQKSVTQLKEQVASFDKNYATKADLKNLPNSGIFDRIILKSTENPNLCVVQKTGAGVGMAQCANSSAERFNMLQ